MFLLKNNSIKEISISYIVRILGSFSLLILTFVITSHFSSYDSGIFLQILSLSIPISTIARFGADSSLIKILKNERLNSFTAYFIVYLYKKATVVSLFLSSFIFISIILVKYLSGEFVFTDYYFALIIPISLLTSINNLNAIILQAKEKIVKSILFRNVLPFLLTTLFVGILICFNIELKLLMVFIIFIFISLCLNLVVNSKLKINFSPLRSKKKDLLSRNYTLLAFYFSIILMGQQWLTILMSTYFLSPSELAYFNLILRIANTLSFILLAVNSIYAQKFAREINSNSHDKLKALLSKATVNSTVLGGFLSIGLFVFAKDILYSFGEEYSKLYILLRLLLFGQLFNLITGPSMQMILMLNSIKDFFYVSLIFTLILTALSFFLTLNYGLEGAVWSQFIILIIVNSTNYLWLKNRLNKMENTNFS